jgi:membrane-bound serine protease (ClpP class)
MPANRYAHHPQRRSSSIYCLRFLLLSLLALGLLGILLPTTADALANVQSNDRPEIDVVELDGTITPVMARYIDRAIGSAEADGRSAVVLEMDTPGGLSSAMDDIIRDVLESEIPVIVYVAPRGARAASAGVYITYAAHVAAMAPGTNIGSATPVSLGGDDDDEETAMDRKVVNDAVAQIVNLANLRGRNAAWAEDAVRNAVNITADEALSLGVIDTVAPDLDTLLTEIDGRQVTMADGSTAALRTANARLHDVGMNPLEGLLQLLADPTIAYILLSLGSLGLFLELSNPGTLVPGTVGALCLLFGLFALGTIPVNWAGLLLMALGLVLFVADVFLPSLGLLTVGGVVSFVVGSFLLIDDNAPPGYDLPAEVIWTVTACFVVLFVLLGLSVLRAMRRRPVTGRSALIGMVGTVKIGIEPTSPGQVFVDGERWKAILAEGSAAIAAGTSIVVTKADGLTLSVRPATAGETAEDVERRAGDRRTVIPVTEGAGAGQ